jgi:putative endonuclease
MKKTNSPFFVYVLRCSDDTFYTGYTTDLENRLQVHNGEGETVSQKTAGAKYTRGRRPVILHYYEELDSKSAAMKREYAIKQLTRKEKEALTNLSPSTMSKGHDRKKEKKKPKKDKPKK